MGKVKTNAMRILETRGISYRALSYDSRDGKIDGVSVAQKVERDPKTVYKTLVTQGNSGGVYVFIIPVEGELDLKKAAATAGEKKIEMIPVKDILKWTGYIRGGCSPIGMKKNYPTFIAQEALKFQNIIVSGGRIGIQIEIEVKDLLSLTKATVADLLK